MRRRAQVLLILWAILFVVPCFATGVHAEKRVALMIGNGAYQKVPALPNPPNDAGALAGSLQRLGFSVLSVTNANFDEMRRALLDFGHRAANADMAVVFFAGHGMEIGGENWLLPVGKRLL